MQDCNHCRQQPDLPYKCNYCGGIFCQTHRLPESHSCDGVRFLSDSGKRFESKASNEVVRTAEEIRKPEPIKPEYTVGSRPDSEFESAPDVELKDCDGSAEADSTGLFDRLKRLFG